MNTPFLRRLARLEQQHKVREDQTPGPSVLPGPLSFEEFAQGMEALQTRAAHGDKDAIWRLERINLFLERAKKRRDNESRL